MKLQILAAAFLAAASFAQAQVPGLINYQGRLTTPSGAPASGTRNFSLSIFDAETGGTLLYTEAVGPVTLDATGVYSFQFGSAGSSNSQVVETLATTDGTASSFQKVLANTGVVAGSLSVTDGTYTWSQSAGSSNEDDFGVAYSSSLRRVTVSYFSAPPAAGKAITATYRYATSGITGAISAGSQHWIALSIDGVPQTGRQRVLAVPFAMKALEADEAKSLKPSPVTFLIPSINDSRYLPFPLALPSTPYGALEYMFNGRHEIQRQFKKFSTLRVIASGDGNTPTEQCVINVKFLEENPIKGESKVLGELVKSGVFNSDFSVPINHIADWSQNRYLIYVSIVAPVDQVIPRYTKIKAIQIIGDE